MAQQEQLNPLPDPRHRAPIASLSWNLEKKKKKKLEISFPPLLFTNQTNSGNYRSRKIARSITISMQIMTARISTQNEKDWSCKSHSSCWWWFGGICCAHTSNACWLRGKPPLVSCLGCCSWWSRIWLKMRHWIQPHLTSPGRRAAGDCSDGWALGYTEPRSHLNRRH